MDNVLTRLCESLSRIGAGGSIPVRAALSGEPVPIDDTECPTADVFESGTQLLVLVDLPGSRRDDVEIALSDDTLTVRARVSEPHPPRVFYRSFGIPLGIDAENARATWAHGVLRIKLPKSNVEPLYAPVAALA